VMRVSTEAGFTLGAASASFVDGETLCYPCGNTVKLHNLRTGEGAFLGGGGYGLGAVAGCAGAGLVVYAEKGPQPAAQIYSFPKLEVRAAHAPCLR
jgi:hypothetical protein